MWAYEMNFVMNHAPGAGLITRTTDASRLEGRESEIERESKKRLKERIKRLTQRVIDREKERE